MKAYVWLSLALLIATPCHAQAGSVAEVVDDLLRAHAISTETSAYGAAQQVGGAGKITAISPDGGQILVSKLQGGQRWAVGLLTSEPFSVSGNVVASDSSTLMWCAAAGAEGEGINATLIFDCSSPDGAVASADEGWSLFAPGVRVPAAFFAP